jgi:O-succinylbenzoate synthase
VKANTREHRIVIPFRAPYADQGLRRVTLLEGPSGWGECSPLPGYPCEESKARRAAVEAACEHWPVAVRDDVEVNALVPALAPDAAARLAAEFVSEGFRTIKIKVGPTATDESRVWAIRDAVGPTVKLRLDCNGTWDIDTAVAVINRLAAVDLEIIEQPVAMLDELARLRRLVSVPLAADESVRSTEDARRLAALDAADAVVVKVQCVGGFSAAMEIGDAVGRPVIVSSLYETSVGLAVGLALAAALPELPYACGLATAGALAADVVTDPLLAVGGRLRVRRPDPDVTLLARYADAS